MIQVIKSVLGLRKFKSGETVVCRYDPWNRSDMFNYCSFFGQGPSVNEIVTVDRYLLKEKNHISLKEYSELFDAFDAGFWDECFESVDKIDLRAISGGFDFRGIRLPIL
jgi:hypothetical protein